MNIGEPAPRTGCWIVVKTLRGLEMALLGGTLSKEQETKYRSTCFDEPSDEHTRGPEPMLQEVEFVDPASEAQIREHYLRRLDEDGVLVRSRQILQNHQLQMKLVDVEYTMDRKKLFFYFTSEQRIDFRAYVRDLAREFRIRIEMRQIGVRDEAKTVRGIAPCGRACCCSYWLHRFTPINIRMVKEQNLALNPTKISGICGRLMCCMAYEHSHYSELWKTLPNPGAKIKTTQGNYILEGVDLQTESVKVRFPEGREVPIPIAEFADFKDTILRGEEWKETPAETLTRRTLLPFRSITSRTVISPKTLRPAVREVRAAEHTKDLAKESKDARNNKKFKPEKISIEEHIAVRISERIPNDKISNERTARSVNERAPHERAPHERVPYERSSHTERSFNERNSRTEKPSRTEKSFNARTADERDPNPPKADAAQKNMPGKKRLRHHKSSKPGKPLSGKPISGKPPSDKPLPNPGAPGERLTRPEQPLQPKQAQQPAQPSRNSAPQKTDAGPRPPREPGGETQKGADDRRRPRPQNVQRSPQRGRDDHSQAPGKEDS
jgi:cell fate regulator YaaT (PSP1 superfamily)